MTESPLTRTVGELVTERPSSSRIFEKLGIDFCCGGNKTLAEASRERGLDPAEVLETLRAEEAPQERPLQWASLAGLCDHIVERYHEPLRAELLRLERLLAKVARVHGRRFGYMVEVHEVFAALAVELLSHMAKEERVLFPAIQELERGAMVNLAAPIQVMEQDHEQAGEALRRLRELTGDYEPPEGACNTFRAVLAGLAELEVELHQHIHLENNILHPGALSSMRAGCA